MITIWEPRWHDRTALIAKYKVQNGLNKIKFIKGTLKGQEFKLSSDIIRSYPIESNGKIDCYVVPLKEFGL
jgi:hypothetical protein